MKNKISTQNILIAIILVIVIANTIVIARLTSAISVGMADAIEASRPAKLNAVIINPSECDSCFSIDSALSGIKNASVLIESETRLDTSDEKAQELITKYSIKKLPTIILTGEIQKDAQLEKAWEKIGEVIGDAVVFTKLKPPYFNVAKGRVVGQVSVTYINDKSCKKCPTYEGYINQLKQGGINVVSEKTIDYKSTSAKNLINKYDISRIPTFILDEEIALYETVANMWPKIGKVAKDGSYVASPVSAPYRDIASDQINGVVSAISLVDSTCNECLNPSAIKQLFSRYQVAYGNEKTVDVSSSEGKALIKKYQIKNIPALILDSQLDAYVALSQVWNQVGTKESDGRYVVRNLSILKGAKYKDLSSNTIITN